MPPSSDWDGWPEPSTPPVEPLSPELSGEEPPSSQLVSQSQVGIGMEDEVLESDEEDGLLEEPEELLDESEELERLLLGDEEYELLWLTEEPETEKELEPESDEETLVDSEVDVEAEALVDEVDPLKEEELMISMSIQC